MATLTGIRIKNFKAVGETPVELKLAPITLLYGPNGAGKSTVLHALHYAREILERGNLDPDRTLAGGELDLGGFRNLVHGRDLQREIVLGFDLELSGGLPFFDYFDELDERTEMGLRVDGRRLGNLHAGRDAGVEIALRWSHILEQPYVARYRIAIDGQHFATIASSPDLKNVAMGEIDFDHPILNAAEDEHPGIVEEELGGTINWLLFHDSAVAAIGVNGTDGALPSLDDALDLDIPEDPEDAAWSAALRTSAGPTPEQSEAARLARREQDAVRNWLSRAVVGPAQVLRDTIGELIAIGPIREVPPRGFRPQTTPDAGRWASGLAAWDRLAAMETSDVAAVDAWLSEGLDSGFGVAVERMRQVADTTAFAAMFERGLSIDDLESLTQAWDALPEHRRVSLYDTRNGMEVEPADIGVGISQILPVVVAALDPDAMLVAIEQPELHIHPKLQTELGDLFAFAVDRSGEPRSPSDHVDRMIGGRGRMLVIETHSEHLVLRLLRRIRETAEGNPEPGAPPVSPETISVNYAEPTGDGLRLHHLRVDETGEFIDRWPEGFFAERRKELF